MVYTPTKKYPYGRDFLFEFRHFWAIFSKSTQNSEILYTSLESPNIQLLESLSTKGVALPTNLPRPFKWKKFEFHSKGPGNFLGMATAHVYKGSESWILGLSKEVYNISEFWVLFEKIAQKDRN